MTEQNTSVPQDIIDIVKGQCWSLWEGCACRYSKNHSGLHECDSVGCHTAWTSEQAEAWMEDERRAHRDNTPVNDRHRKRN